MFEVSSKGISTIFPCKQLTAVDGVVTHKDLQVKCHWCKWSPRPEDITGADGLLLRGFTQVNGLAKLAQRRRPYRLVAHSCRGRKAKSLQILTIYKPIGKPKAEVEAPKAKAEAQAVEVG